ncbi:MAG: DUF808 domain-containing protein [Gammaproteobacteria bacterium]
MATSLLALLDDITTILDDVALLTKVAAKKTSGVLGDDLALNAQQVSGVAADRELPVVWAVAKGSLANKAILVPAALAISAVAPWLVSPLLMVGGAFLCYEGFEKVMHAFVRRRGGGKAIDEARKEELSQALADPAVDLVTLERDRIRGAVRTDFILSAEIIVISLGTVAAAPLPQRVVTLVSIALLMTVGVYGLVAGIVKLDDGGLLLIRRPGGGWFARAQRSLGRGILRAAPWLMKGLSIAGTIAMFLVGGGIIGHGVPALHHWLDGLPGGVSMSVLANAVIGLIAGAVVAGAVSNLAILRRRWSRVK